MSIPPRLHIVIDGDEHAEPTRRFTPAELAGIFPPLRSQADLDAMPRPGVSAKLRRITIAAVVVAIIVNVLVVIRIIDWSVTK